MAAQPKSAPLKKIRSWLKQGFLATERFFLEKDLLKIISHSFRHDLLASEKWMVGLIIAAMLLIPSVTTIINILGAQFDAPSVMAWAGLFPGCLTVFFLCLKLRKKTVYWGSVLTLVFASITSFVALVAGATSIMSTPFGANDLSHGLLQLDNWLGFHQAAIMNWRAHYPGLTHWLTQAYDSIFLQVSLTPIILGLLACFRSARLYILTVIIATLIAYLIYYFWPTFAPAYVIHDAVFPKSAAHLIERTLHIRQHVHYELYPGAGLIAFPSCHVVMGLAGIFSWFYAYQETKHKKLKPILFVLGILSLALNLSLIAATVLLGYHYLVDVIASLIIFTASWLWLTSMTRKEPH
jgi:membrane-associated phospholipid phosphatase